MNEETIQFISAVKSAIGNDKELENKFLDLFCKGDKNKFLDLFYKGGEKCQSKK